MTRQSSFKRIVRARMQATGESYTAARAMLLAAEKPKGPETPVLATSDEAIRGRTGRGWEQWFDLLDGWGATTLSHREIARRVAGELGIDPLAWNVQAVTVSYERVRGMRAVGERADGFAVTAQKTVAVPAARLHAAFVDDDLRTRWLPEGGLRTRTTTAPTSARFDWGDGETRVSVFVSAKGPTRSVAALEHTRLDDGAEAQRMKAF
jgi:hypothetical protein